MFFRLLPLFLVAAGCFSVKTYRPPAPGEAVEAAVSFDAQERRIAELLATTEDNDQRDRLLHLQDLLAALRRADPKAQRAVAAFVDRMLEVEARGLNQTVGVDLGLGDIDEETLSAPETRMTPIPGASATPLSAPPPADPLADPKAAYERGEWKEALRLLEGKSGDAAVELKKSATDGYVRAERERAGHLVLTARTAAAGPDRTRSLEEAQVILEGLLRDWPESTLTADVKSSLELVKSMPR